MDEEATEDQRALLDVSTRFMEDTGPLSSVRAGTWRDPDAAEAHRRQAAELGWYSMLVPEALGGGCVSGDGAVDAALIAYRRGQRVQPGAYIGTNVVAHAVAAAGSTWATEKVLPTLVSGQRPAAWVVDVARDGTAGVGAEVVDGRGLVLSGTVRGVMDVEPTSWLLVVADTPAGTTQALVSADAPGVTTVELESLDLARRFCAVTFDGVEVEAAAMVGEPGDADGLVTDELALASMLTTAEMVGAMDRDVEMAVQYAKDRIAFGRPIGSFQGIKHQLADISLGLEMSKAITLAAARAISAGDDHGPSAASMAKAFVGEIGIELVQTCFQVFGGIGYTWEHDQHLYLRRVTSDAQLFGDANWHRERICRLAGI